MLVLLLSSTIVASSSFQAIGRNRKITFPSNPNVRSLTSTDSWYFIQFYQTPDLPTLQANGITLDSHSLITSRLYCLYLTHSQTSFLITSKLATVVQVQDKLIDNTVSLTDADYLIAEVSPTFNPQDFPSFHFRFLRQNSYLITSSDFRKCVDALSTSPAVYAISPLKHPHSHNRFSSGYSQFNTKTADESVTFPRYLEPKGINGSGIVVTVLDSYLDPFSTFFVDPNVTIANATCNFEHRKLVYVDWPADKAMGSSEHGTHVAGTVAGVALLPEYSAFDGIARGAKLAFQSWHVAPHTTLERHVDGPAIMNAAGSHIHSNSWGAGTFIAEYDCFVNDEALHEQDKLFIFSAGNGGMDNPQLDGYRTLPSPSGSKNALTVGAVAQLQVSGSESTAVWIGMTGQRANATVEARRFPWSKNPFAGDPAPLGGFPTVDFDMPNFTGKIMVVTELAQLERLNNSETLPLAAITPYDLAPDGAIQFPVFHSTSSLLMWLLQTAEPGEAIHFRIDLQIRPDEGKESTLWDWSSKGPAFLGIMKPDVVAPGSTIVSARSSPTHSPDSGSDRLEIAATSGTSQATPNVAGSVALIEQYFKDGFHKGISVAPSGMLLRAVIITTADPLIPGDKTINAGSGFGQINLGKHLPFSGDPFSLEIGDVITIGEPPHLVTNFSVINTSREVRLTIAYVDAVANEDAILPLLCDLDLIVVSPSRRVFRGNRRTDNTEERFSTVERVIIDPDELELGRYEVHVIALNPSVAKTANFSIAAVGAITIDSQYFAFEPATACATDCGEGTCDSSTFICSCPASKVGQSCQTGVESNNAAGSTVAFELPAWGLKWLTFTNDDEVTGLATFKVTPETLGGGFRVYAVNRGRSDLPRDFDQLYVEISEFTGNVALTSSSDGLSLLIRNDSPHTQRLSVHVESQEVATDPTRVSRSATTVSAGSTGLAVGIIVLIVVLGVGVVVGIIVGVICYKRKKLAKEEGWTFSKDSTTAI